MSFKTLEEAQEYLNLQKNYHKNYYKNNKELINERAKTYYYENLEYKKNYNYKYRNKNKDYFINYKLNMSNPALPIISGNYEHLAMFGFDTAIPLGPTVIRSEAAFFPKYLP